jgi:hypothetical protein
MVGDKGDAAREQTNCLWGRSDDHWFRMAIGGVIHYRYRAGVDVMIPKANPLPEFLNPEKVRALDESPTVVRVIVGAAKGDALEIEVEVASRSRTPTQITAFHGANDALTFVERWEKKTELGEMTAGKRAFKINGVPKAGFLRIKATNETGIFFNSEPAVWQ